MIRVLIGLQADAATEATKFLPLKTVSTDLDYGLTEIDSQAVTGIEWSEQGITSVGPLAGSVTTELTRKLNELLLEAAGFDKDDATVDSILDAPDVATYGYLTIIQEFVDEGGAAHYDKHVGCIVNTLALNLVTDQYVQATISPVSLTKGQTIAGTFAGTVEADDSDILFCEKSVIKMDTVAEECELTSFTVEINNNLSTEKSLCGDYILQKGQKRAINISSSSPRLKTAHYMAEFEKSKNGTGIAAEISLKNVKDEEVAIAIPKITYTEVKRGDLTGNGSLSKSLTAKWDAIASKIATFTFKGMGTGV